MSHLRLVEQKAIVLEHPAVAARTLREAEAAIADCEAVATNALRIFREYMDLATDLRRRFDLPEDFA